MNMQTYTHLSQKSMFLLSPDMKAGTRDGGFQLLVCITSPPWNPNPQKVATGRPKARAKAKLHSLAIRSTIARSNCWAFNVLKSVLSSSIILQWTCVTQYTSVGRVKGASALFQIMGP